MIERLTLKLRCKYAQDKPKVEQIDQYHIKQVFVGTCICTGGKSEYSYVTAGAS